MDEACPGVAQSEAGPGYAASRTTPGQALLILRATACVALVVVESEILLVYILVREAERSRIPALPCYFKDDFPAGVRSVALRLATPADTISESRFCRGERGLAAAADAGAVVCASRGVCFS